MLISKIFFLKSSSVVPPPLLTSHTFIPVPGKPILLGIGEDYNRAESKAQKKFSRITFLKTKSLGAESTPDISKCFRPRDTRNIELPKSRRLRKVEFPTMPLSQLRCTKYPPGWRKGEKRVGDKTMRVSLEGAIVIPLKCGQVQERYEIPPK